MKMILDHTSALIITSTVKFIKPLSVDQYLAANQSSSQASIFDLMIRLLVELTVLTILES